MGLTCGLHGHDYADDFLFSLLCAFEMLLLVLCLGLASLLIDLLMTFFFAA